MKTHATIHTESSAYETFKGNWNIIKGRLKQEYGELTDNDLTYVEGQEEELIGRLQKRTGRARKEIERVINDSCNGE